MKLLVYGAGMIGCELTHVLERGSEIGGGHGGFPVQEGGKFEYCYDP